MYQHFVREAMNYVVHKLGPVGTIPDADTIEEFRKGFWRSTPIGFLVDQYGHRAAVQWARGVLAEIDCEKDPIAQVISEIEDAWGTPAANAFKRKYL